jgi:bifunctional non-homologous end joining protein LigD
MGLIQYKKKRNFSETPEPSGKHTKSKSKLIFVVQRHKASHLHYDFRLEMEGVLKSWAVPKGPSMNPQDKRLAMMVEDHPYDYKDFAGIIPEGNYGAGIVEIWDNGEVSDLENSDTKTTQKHLLAGLHLGNLKFRLHGKKLKGEFVLVKTKGRGENAWLLIKHNDEFAVHEDYNSELLTPANSPINRWLKQNRPDKLVSSAARRQRIKSSAKKVPVAIGVKKKEPVKKIREKSEHFIPAMLARETDKPFSNKEWIYEMKWDGYRAIAELDGDDVKLYSRNGNSFLNTYPIVVQELKKLNLDAVIDGEIIIVDENGKSDFQKLQYYQSDSEYPIEYRVFDILFYKGENLCEQPLIERKKILKKILPKNEVVKYSDHIEEKGLEFFEAAVEKDLEGIMAKKADSLYYPGIRTTEWLKIKHHKTTEVIIAGFTEPGGSRKHFGALALGVMQGKELKYVGLSGSGYTDKSLSELYKKLKPLIRESSPFKERIRERMPITWVEPKLVCEIKYTEWTRDGKLRHPIFVRLREDKKPSEITMNAEKPVKQPIGKTSSKKISKAKKK